MNRLNIQERAKILCCLVEGDSMRATARIANVDKKTVVRLIAEFSAACHKMHDKRVRNGKSIRVRCDEMWALCYSKEKNVPED